MRIPLLCHADCMVNFHGLPRIHQIAQARSGAFSSVKGAFQLIERKRLAQELICAQFRYAGPVRRISVSAHYDNVAGARG